MRYMLLINVDENEIAGWPEGRLDQEMNACFEVREEMKQQGVFLASERLRPGTTHATTVRKRDNKVTMTDGPHGVRASRHEAARPVGPTTAFPTGVSMASTWNPDLIVVAAFGQILKKDVLDLPRYGCINVHASLLPRWRGAVTCRLIKSSATAAKSSYAR